MRLVASERGWRLQILVEPRSKFVQFLGVGTGDVLRLQRLRRRMEDSLVNMTLLVFGADDKTDVFPLAGRVVTLQDEALVLCLDERKAAGDAGEDRARAASAVTRSLVSLLPSARVSPKIERAPRLLTLSRLPYFSTN